MSNVFHLSDHPARASGAKTKKSSAVTAPSVTRAMRSATSREGQPLPSQREVTQPPVTPIDWANSPFLTPLSSSQVANFMTGTFSPAKISAQVKILAPLHRQMNAVGRKFRMAKPKQKQRDIVQTRFKTSVLRPTFIRQWRLKKGWNQGQLAEAIGVSTATISQIENAKTGYTQAHLEAIAEALSCDPADLLVRDPSDPSAIWSLWDRAQPAQRKQVLRIIEGLLGDESDVA